MKVKNISRVATLLVSISFIIFGVLREEQITMLSKAVAICLECIGIG